MLQGPGVGRLGGSEANEGLKGWGWGVDTEEGNHASPVNFS